MCFFIGLLLMMLPAQAAEHKPLLPRPQEVRYGSGHLALRGLTIRFSSAPGPEDRFAAHELSSALSAAAQSRVAVVKNASPGRAIVSAAGHGNNAAAETIAVPVHGGTPRKLCSEYCPGGWSPDGKFLYIGSLLGSSAGTVLTIPVPVGKSLPDLPVSGVRSAAGWVELPGAKVIGRSVLVNNVSPGPSFSTYVFTKTDLQRNLFRIRLH